MPAQQIHLVRHGEVHNPEHVLYGRLDGFGLSDLGHRMAAASAEAFHEQGVPVRAVYASPLQRTRESAAPWSAAFGLETQVDERLVEPSNKYEGRRSDFSIAKQLKVPAEWPWIVNPLKPSWGEAYVSIAARMLSAIDEAWSSVDEGDVVLVSHQLPIWMVHRSVTGARLFHDPRRRRCTLSSITTLERREGGFVEVGYQEPAAHLNQSAVDLGAV
ncbi:MULTISPECIES: histidine phosphatase family protein [unclassified Frigoribacterium]|uniref:histidine phosphatase family protein n=1 Tax=unclassified Frigoribacterium TaxID=2627005 RepID=UPI0006F6D149|nr:MULTISPECIES: histidine phosphatase family protein [unclassified Frigoribacterium]KQO46447.1 phosphoglycerate mutase [Frigoribacterium sp. Leaf254]KQT38540.1 phosphoglycerate mutase [Frigoribacterium sp. Leaf415]